MSFSQYQDISNSFRSSSSEEIIPLYSFWDNQPLSNESWINPRMAGYNPTRQYIRIKQNQPWMDESCAVYQQSCDLILPANKCYLHNHQIILPP